MRKKSRFSIKAQRAADGGIVVRRGWLNGLSRAAQNPDRRVGVVGNRTRYQSGMYNYVHAKWTEVNLSGTALMNISVSGRKAW